MRNYINRMKSVKLNRTSPQINEDFNEDTYYRSNNPMRIISRIHGMNPVSVNKKTGKVCLSPFHTMYGVAVISLAVGVKMYLEPRPNSQFFLQVLYFKSLLLPLGNIIGPLFLVFNIKKIGIVLSGSSKLCKYLSLSQLKKMFWQQIFLFLAGYLCMTCYNIFVYIVEPKAFDGLGPIAKFIDTFLTLNIWIIKIQFFTCIFYLSNILVSLRRFLLHSRREIFPPQPDVYDLMSLYDEVLRIAEACNSCFGLTLGLSSSLTTVDCIVTAYVQIVLTQQGNIDSGFSLIVWLGIDFLQEWIVLKSTETFMAEAGKVAIDVHNVMRSVRDQYVVQQLQQFSLFLIHRRMRFTICGLVPLDYSLLFTIAGGVTTYMVVLLQFQKAENNPNSVGNLTSLLT